MDIIKILYASFEQEKLEKEHILQILLNSPQNLLTQIEDSKKVIADLANIDNSIKTLESLIGGES